jgi:geranylgeranyl pyrophosphate synthase
MQQVDFTTELKDKAALTDRVLEQVLADQTGIPSRLKEAMRYMLFSPGKKVRSAMVLWCCGCQRAVNPSAMIGAAAIEMVHTYSLIHDDLPAMDDDDLRRGQPSCHKQFDEATAILAGDGLLTLAFEILSTQVEDSCAALKMVRTLSQAAGPSGMVGGRWMT